MLKMRVVMYTFSAQIMWQHPLDVKHGCFQEIPVSCSSRTEGSMFSGCTPLPLRWARKDVRNSQHHERPLTRGGAMKACFP